jgi:type IV secretory pathway VirJ component
MHPTNSAQMFVEWCGGESPLQSPWRRIAGLLWHVGKGFYKFERFHAFGEAFDLVCRCTRRPASPDHQAMTRRWLGLGCLLPVMCVNGPAASADDGPLGQVRVVKPSGAARGLVVLFSDAAGWTGSDDDAAQALAHEGALVIGVNTAAYLTRASKSRKDRDHLYLVGDAFDANELAQRQAGISTYLTPTLAGIGEGGTLAELMLAQAPPATIAGAVSIDPTATIDLARPLAAEPPARPRYHEDLQRDAVISLPGFWSVGLTPDASKYGRDRVQRLKQGGMAVEITEFPDAMPPADALAALMAPHLQPAFAPSSASLPLVELPADRPSDVMAILLSGDGGWADLDKTIAEELQHDGVPVVGWDTLRYFWARKTPDQVAQDLAGVMSTYPQRWHASKVLLIGYSLGADVLPFAYTRLPEALQQHVIRIALLAVEAKVDFEVEVDGWEPSPPVDHRLPLEPEVAKIPASLVLCIYGAEEKHSGCPGLAGRGVTVVRTNGSHHFDGDYPALERRILGSADP